MTVRAAVALVLALPTLALAAPPTPIEPYRAAASEGRRGRVEGRAYVERRSPDGPDTALSGLVLTLAPLSVEFLAEVEAVRLHARDSLSAYRQAATRIFNLEEGYLWSLRSQGAGDLLMLQVVGADGGFTFTGVPAGRWLLLARAETRTAVDQRRPQRTQVPFDLAPPMVGYRTASFWVVPVTVNAGEAATVELTDRNVWYTGIIEDLAKAKEPRVLPGRRR